MTAKLAEFDPSGMKTISVVGMGALSFQFFIWALAEMRPGHGGIAHLLVLGGFLLWSMMAWRICGAD